MLWASLLATAASGGGRTISVSFGSGEVNRAEDGVGTGAGQTVATEAVQRVHGRRGLYDDFLCTSMARELTLWVLVWPRCWLVEEWHSSLFSGNAAVVR